MAVSDLMVTGYVNVETFIFVKYLYSARERRYILVLKAQQKNIITSFIYIYSTDPNGKYNIN